MSTRSESHIIGDLEALERIYGEPSKASIVKEVAFVHPHYRALIEAAPFAVLATVGPDGVDATPRGDTPGFVVVEDEKTLLMPDRRGNNRVDSLRNIISDPRVSLFFLIPGIGETLRVLGQAAISVEPDLLERFAVDGKPPRSVLVIDVRSVFFQCARAIIRSDLWNPEKHVARGVLPSTGTILSTLSDNTIDAAAYDHALPGRAKTTLY
ncbi:MAG: pyridoxamine 5'-phosphate oxidase family protein [Methyloligellaceae bacterium]